MIQSSLKEKDTLLREIHHRVKNNLQVISSLLSLQTYKTTDEKAIEALKEGQSRVQSMSLIHQNLYNEDNLTGIEMKPYLEKLIHNLIVTYNISIDKVDFQTQIESLNLDIDTVVPLGLIINELISNALKYAFPNESKGLIHVTLEEKDNLLILIVKDNGVGGINLNTVNSNGGFGFDMIRAFADNLDAEIDIINEGGTCVTLKIKDYQKL